MDSKNTLQCRHFVSYSGVELPLKLITQLDAESVDRRITYFRGYYNQQQQLVAVEKVVYGEIEFEHRYQYYPDGRLQTVELREAEETPRLLHFE